MEEFNVGVLLNILEANPKLVDIVVKEEKEKEGIRNGKVYNKQGKVIGLQG